MKVQLSIMAGLVLAVLFWYGYSFSMTEHGFFVQGYIGTLIPLVLGGWLFACGQIVARMK